MYNLYFQISRSKPRVGIQPREGSREQVTRLLHIIYYIKIVKIFVFGDTLGCIFFGDIPIINAPDLLKSEILPIK